MAKVESGIGYGEGTKKQRSGFHLPKKYVHEEALKSHSKSKALSKAKGGYDEAKKKTYGVHQLHLKDEPRHKTLSGKEVKY